MLSLCIVAGVLALSDVCLGGVTSAQKVAIVNQHNQLRASEQWATNMQTMYWDNALAAEAQAIADTCIYGHVSVSTAKFPKVGQNLAAGHASWTVAINDWYAEKADLIFGVGKTGDVGHYTQMVWATTNNIGCGYKYCGGQKIYVCNYGPAGNVIGSLYTPYNMGSQGESDCGASMVDSTHPTLCDTQGEVCLNRGTMNLQTGDCECYGDLPIFDEDDSCQVDCSNAHEKAAYASFCQSQAANGGCETFFNVPYEYCPFTCGLCAPLLG